MTIRLNGTPVEVPDGATVAAVIKMQQGEVAGKSLAVAVNDMFIPRDRWADHRLEPDADMVLIGAAYGG